MVTRWWGVGKPVEAGAPSAAGKTARIGVVRDGRTLGVAVEVGQRWAQTASADASQSSPTQAAALGRLGVTVAPVTDEVRSSLGLARGVDGAVVTSVKPDGAAAEAGLAAGDVIEKIDGRAIKAPGDIAQAIRDAKSPSVLALINRHGNTLFVGIKLAANPLLRPLKKRTLAMLRDLSFRPATAE